MAHTTHIIFFFDGVCEESPKNAEHTVYLPFWEKIKPVPAKHSHPYSGLPGILVEDPFLKMKKPRVSI